MVGSTDGRSVDLYSYMYPSSVVFVAYGAIPREIKFLYEDVIIILF